MVTATTRYRNQGVPAIAEDRIYLPIGSNLFRCLDARTGDTLWKYETSPLLYCLDGRGNADGTPKLLWAYRMGDKVEESVPCLYGDLLFILSCDGYLHAVR